MTITLLFFRVFQDMDLIESLWKQDEDMGLTLADFMPKNDETTRENEIEDEKEKLKALEAINAANDKVSPWFFPQKITTTHV